MGVEEIALLEIASQVLQGAQQFCQQAGAFVTSPTAQLGYRLGGLVLANLNALVDAGLVAAAAEFKVTQAAEKTWVADAESLPPIT